MSSRALFFWTSSYASPIGIPSRMPGLFWLAEGGLFRVAVKKTQRLNYTSCLCG